MMRKILGRVRSAAHRNRECSERQESPANLLGIFFNPPRTRLTPRNSRAEPACLRPDFLFLRQPSPRSYSKYPRAIPVAFVIRNRLRPKFLPLVICARAMTRREYGLIWHQPEGNAFVRPGIGGRELFGKNAGKIETRPRNGGLLVTFLRDDHEEN